MRYGGNGKSGFDGCDALAGPCDAVARAARGAGLPVLYGDAADEALLQEVGLMRVNAVIITFAEPVLAVGIVDVVRRLRPDVPILVRTVDDQHLTALQAAGATEVVPDTFESSLMLASHALQLLGQPAQEVMQGMDAIRAERYRQLRGLWTGEDERLSSDSQPPVEEIRAVVLPPQAWGVGRSIGELSEALSDVTVSAVRRHGIVGPEPAGSLCLQAGDELVLAGLPSALAHAEQILLTG